MVWFWKSYDSAAVRRSVVHVWNTGIGRRKEKNRARRNPVLLFCGTDAYGSLGHASGYAGKDGFDRDIVYGRIVGLCMGSGKKDGDGGCKDFGSDSHDGRLGLYSAAFISGNGFIPGIQHLPASDMEKRYQDRISFCAVSGSRNGDSHGFVKRLVLNYINGG